MKSRRPGPVYSNWESDQYLIPVISSTSWLSQLPGMCGHICECPARPGCLMRVWRERHLSTGSGNTELRSVVSRSSHRHHRDTCDTVTLLQIVIKWTQSALTPVSSVNTCEASRGCHIHNPVTPNAPGWSLFVTDNHNSSTAFSSSVSLSVV